MRSPQLLSITVEREKKLCTKWSAVSLTISDFELLNAKNRLQSSSLVTVIGQNSLSKVQDMITRLGESDFYYWIALTLPVWPLIVIVQAKYRLSSMQITTSAS